MNMPRCRCEIGKTSDEWSLGAYRDRIGNVEFILWKSGVGFRDTVSCNPKDLKKLHKWIGKIIEYQDRE